MRIRTVLYTALIGSSLLFLACHGTRPANIGVRNGKLAPCPATPNCVSSQATDEQQRIAPLPFTGTSPAAMDRLAGIVTSLPRAVVIERGDGYLYAEFTSRVFRFVDDVEFLADDARKVIHVRSASRIGRSDLGVNRKRIERIRSLWMNAPRP